MPPRTHASADAYDPFEDTRGPVGHASHFDVERIPGGAAGEPARFRKTIKPGTGADLLPMIHHENLLLMDMAARQLRHVAQPLAFTRDSSDTPFVVTTLDAGPSLNLWRRHDFLPFVREGGAPADARSFLTPAVLLRLLHHLLLALREFHDAGFIHCDIHAGNVCLPFERRPGAVGVVPAVRPSFEQLRLIDFGHTLSARLKFDEPMRLDPEAPESLRRVSPAFRAALRRDAAGRRADAVLKLDFRLDLHALGALAAQFLGAVDWSGEPRAPALHPAMTAGIDAMLAIDCDDSPPAAGLHERLLGPIDDMLARLEPPAGDWLIPLRREAGASPPSPEAARETPLVAALPVVEPPLPAATPLAAPAAPRLATPVPRAAGRRNALLALAGGAGAAVAAWAWHAGHLPAVPPPPGRSAAPAPVFAPPPAPVRSAAPPPPTVVAPAPAPSSPTPALTDREVDDRLNTMIESAAAGLWKRVESAAREIDAAAPVNVNSESPLVASGAEAIERGDYGDAASTLRRATVRAPDDWRTWSALGYALLRLNDLGGARTAVTRGLRLHPRDAGAWARLGEILALQENPAASTATLRLAVYFSTQRPRTLAYLRATARTLLPPAFQAVIRNQGSELDHIPERRP